MQKLETFLITALTASCTMRETSSSTTTYQTPAEDRLFLFDGVISQPATIVPKLFGDKPFWVPHAFFNLCPFVRGPDIDPVWATGCAPLPFPEMNAFGMPQQSSQEIALRLQALQQQQLQQAEMEEEQPTWWEQNKPQGPIDFGMANVHGPIQQEVMYRDYGDGEASARGGGGRLFGGTRTSGRTGSTGGLWSIWG